MSVHTDAHEQAQRHNIDRDFSLFNSGARATKYLPTMATAEATTSNKLDAEAANPTVKINNKSVEQVKTVSKPYIQLVFMHVNLKKKKTKQKII